MSNDKKGMLWLDSNTEKPIEQKITEAINYFVKKYKGIQPVEIYVSMNMEDKIKDKTFIVPVFTVRWIMPNHMMLVIPEGIELSSEVDIDKSKESNSGFHDMESDSGSGKGKRKKGVKRKLT